MTTDRWMRASDQERETAADVLRDAYAVGRLTRDEFDQRTVAAYSALTRGELRDLTADLPVPPAGGFPADTVARRDAARRGWAPMIWMCLLVLVVGLAGHAGAVWVLAAWMVPVLFLVALRGRTGGSRRG